MFRQPPECDNEGNYKPMQESYEPNLPCVALWSLMVIFANGASSTSIINDESEGSDAFLEALNYVCTELAKELARDGEGAQRLIEVTVDGAATLKEARTASREIVSSLLVKAMVHGRDPNWGRIVMALGKSGVDLQEKEVDIYHTLIAIHCHTLRPL